MCSPASTIKKSFSTLVLVLASCALVVAGYQVGTGRWHATPVMSGSMRPAMQPGDVVVTQRVPVSDLHVRDVVVFYPPGHDQHLTVHRIVKLTVSGGTTSISTWGDANPVIDPPVSSIRGTTAYRVVRIIPLIGYPAIRLQNGNRGLMAIGLGALLLIAAAVTVMRPATAAGGPVPVALGSVPVALGPVPAIPGQVPVTSGPIRERS